MTNTPHFVILFIISGKNDESVEMFHVVSEQTFQDFPKFISSVKINVKVK